MADKERVQRSQYADDEKAMKVIVRIWITFFVVLIAFSCACGFGITYLLDLVFDDLNNHWPAEGVSGGIFLIISVSAVIQGWSQIPQNHIWIISLFGKAAMDKEAGLYFLFPWFGFIEIDQVYIGEQRMRLFMDEQELALSRLEYRGLGDVEFKDSSAPVVSSVFFKIDKNLARYAAFNIDDLFTGIEDKIESAIRSFLAQYTVDQASELKARFSLIDIMNGQYITEKSEDKMSCFSDRDKLEEYLRQESMLWKEIHHNWGVRILQIAISDVNLSPSTKTARELVLLAKKNAEAAVFKSKENITLADGNQKALIKEGIGFARQVKQLKDEGLHPEQATNYLSTRLKWENVGKKGATVITDGNDGGAAGFGVKLAAGMKVLPEPTSKTENKTKK